MQGRKRRDIAFFNSFNQFGNGAPPSSGSLFFWLSQHPPQWFPSMPKAILPFGYTLWMPLSVPLGFD
jgi:hypothetical protein